MKRGKPEEWETRLSVERVPKTWTDSNRVRRECIGVLNEEVVDLQRIGPSERNRSVTFCRRRKKETERETEGMDEVSRIMIDYINKPKIKNQRGKERVVEGELGYIRGSLVPVTKVVMTKRSKILPRPCIIHEFIKKLLI